MEVETGGGTGEEGRCGGELGDWVVDKDGGLGGGGSDKTTGVIGWSPVEASGGIKLLLLLLFRVIATLSNQLGDGGIIIGSEFAESNKAVPLPPVLHCFRLLLTKHAAPLSKLRLSNTTDCFDLFPRKVL